MKDKKQYEHYYKYDLVYVDLGKKPGGIQSGIRPVMIISGNAANRANSPILTVAPLTTKAKAHPVHVAIDASDIKGYKMEKTSYILIEQIQTIHKGQIKAKIGYASKDTKIRSLVDAAISRFLNLEGQVNE